MLLKELEENSIKDDYFKIASLIEIKNQFRGNFPITIKDLDEAIDFFEKKVKVISK